MEKYSVLMSLYIKEKPEYLFQSIESMINQTVKPDEIVIVKDGPLTSELEEVLNKFIVKYPDLFKIVISEENIGLGLALNLGLKKCRNELVARMDTDDISLPGRCENQLKCFEKLPSLSIVGGIIEEFIDVPSNVVGKRVVPLEDDEIRNYMKKRCPFNHVTVMFKKSEILKVGSYKHWFWNEDYFLWIRMLEHNCKFKNLSDTLVDVRVGRDMYMRRGGIKYFINEANIQRYMHKKHIIGNLRYIFNVGIRFVLQVLMPNKVRGFIFKKFARS